MLDRTAPLTGKTHPIPVASRGCRGSACQVGTIDRPGPRVYAVRSTEYAVLCISIYLYI